MTQDNKKEASELIAEFAKRILQGKDCSDLEKEIAPYVAEYVAEVGDEETAVVTELALRIYRKEDYTDLDPPQEIIDLLADEKVLESVITGIVVGCILSGQEVSTLKLPEELIDSIKKKINYPEPELIEQAAMKILKNEDCSEFPPQIIEALKANFTLFERIWNNQDYSDLNPPAEHVEYIKKRMASYQAAQSAGKEGATC